MNKTKARYFALNLMAIFFNYYLLYTACRPARFSSTDSTAASTSSTSTVNLKENLEEFAELQRKIENQNQPHQPQSPPQIHGVPTSPMISTISQSNSVLKRALEEGSMLHHQNSVSRQNSNNPNGHGQAGGHGVPAMEETKLASVLSMVMCCQNITTVMDDLFEHVRKEIKTQSAMLNINPGEFFKVFYFKRLKSF